MPQRLFNLEYFLILIVAVSLQLLCTLDWSGLGRRALAAAAARRAAKRPEALVAAGVQRAHNEVERLRKSERLALEAMMIAGHGE